MQHRPTVGPGSQKAPFRERLPGTISKLGKGAALPRWQSMGIAKVASMGGGGALSMGMATVTLVTLVSHSQLRWQGVTQGRVAPVFPFGASP